MLGAVNPDPTKNRSCTAKRSLSHLWERVGVRVNRKFTTLTFILSLLKEGEEALGGGKAGRESEENCRIRVKLSGHEESSYITGETVHVNGGWLMR